MAISTWSLERLEDLAERDDLIDYCLISDLQQYAAELAVEYRKLAGLPERVFENEDEDEEE